MRVEGYVNASGVFVFVEHFLPRLAAIGCAENAALSVWPVGVAKGRHKNNIGIAGIDDDLADGTGIAQSNVLPGLAAVERFVDPIPLRNVAANAGFTRADVNRVVIGVGYRQAANGSSSLFIEHWRPTQCAVRGLPYAATGHPEIIGCGIAGNSGCGQRASATEGSDETVLHAFERLVFGLAGLLITRVLLVGGGCV